MTHEVREMDLPSGPSTLRLVFLILLSDVCFQIYARQTYDMESYSYRIWRWCHHTKAYDSYKRYIVEDKVRAKHWRYLFRLKNLP